MAETTTKKELDKWAKEAAAAQVRKRKEMSNEELIVRLNSIEQRIFTLQRDLPDEVMAVLRKYFSARFKEQNNG